MANLELDQLIKRIIVGLVIGTVLALVIPGNEIIEMLGTLFVNATENVAPSLCSSW